MMSVQHWFLSPLLSPSEVHSLEGRLEEALPQVKLTGILTELCYNVETDGQLTAAELDRLKWLLSETEDQLPTEETCLKADPAGKSLIVEVGPRLSFTTAFSTNAVSIATSAGLDKVRRIEPSRRYQLFVDEAAAGDGPEPGAVAAAVAPLVHDRMTEMVYASPLASFVPAGAPGRAEAAVFSVPVLAEGRAALERLNLAMGLAMDAFDLDLYTDLFRAQLGRDPTNVEVFDLAQSNSEHSRHWFFRGEHEIDGERMPRSLFQLVQDTQRTSNRNSTVAFCDNSSAIEGPVCRVLLPADPGRASPFAEAEEQRDVCLTAETHNFPTGVAPFPGATTGTGGRIRDVQSTGRGAHVVAGTAGYAVGHLHLPGYRLAWEEESAAWPYPDNLARPREVLLRASDGASDYGNKFGEPVVAGFARSLAVPASAAGERVEWLKPIMFSGGVGQLPAWGRRKTAPRPGMLVAKVGGPAFRIGVGGGAASSVLVHGDNAPDLDFNAVQRGDAEMEQKMNRVVRACVEMATCPVAAIHDQGAGGNGNVLKEICEPVGAEIDAAAFALGDPTLSALELWGAEYQESNALLLPAEPWARQRLEAVARREKCPLDVVGRITGDGRIRLVAADGSTPVDLDLALVLGAMPRKTFRSTRRALPPALLSPPAGLTARAALELVVRRAAVGSKRFLTNKVDRSVSGLVARQQCVGPLHTPLADVAVLAAGPWAHDGAATALGEQPAKLLLSPAAGARLALAEALTNLAMAPVTALRDVKASCNWMWPAKLPHEAAALYDACAALAAMMEELGVAVDGGKDSLSMAARVAAPGGETTVVKSPRCLVVSAYARCTDLRRVLTPALRGGGVLLLVRPLSASAAPSLRLGGSALAACLGQLGPAPPDVDDAAALARAFSAVQRLVAAGALWAGHDVSDGGLLVALLEMAFAGQCGLAADLGPAGAGDDPLALCFAEEPGWVLEAPPDGLAAVAAELEAADVFARVVGRSLTTRERAIRVRGPGGELLAEPDLAPLFTAWEETSHRLELLQCEPECARAEQRALAAGRWPEYRVPFEWAPLGPRMKSPPKMAVLREEGSNGDRELAVAFHKAGFEVWDVCMQDLQGEDGPALLRQMRGIAFAGGFSYADVLGSAKGWAAGIICNPALRAAFAAFRSRTDTFSLGICNGCQVMARLGFFDGAGAGSAPGPAVRLERNVSGRFESRFPVVRVEASPCVLMRGMAGAQLGVWVAHGEGRFRLDEARADAAPVLRYCGPDGPSDAYPFNPNGSQAQLAAVCSSDGRHTAMMPHPERSVVPWQWPWLAPGDAEAWGDAAPWMQLFNNALQWCLATEAD